MQAASPATGWSCSRAVTPRARRRAGGDQADPRRRRQRLDHRPQLFPAAEGAGAGAPGSGDQDLSRAGVSRRRARAAKPAVEVTDDGPWLDPAEVRTRLLLFGRPSAEVLEPMLGSGALAACRRRPLRSTRCSGPPASAMGCPCCCAGTSPRPVTAVPTGYTSPSRSGGGRQGAAGSRLPDWRLLRAVAP